MADALQTRRWLRDARALAEAQDLVAGRRQLYARGLPRWLVQREVRRGRWQLVGSQCVVLHNGPLLPAARRRAAVLEMGSRAALDGVTSLQVAGVDSLTDQDIHVIVPRGTRHRRMKGVVVHESRRFSEADVLTVGIRRTRPAVAAVHAALWSVTEKQAALMVTLVVQQRLASVASLREAMSPVRRHRWRRPLLVVLAELDGGVRSLTELDVGRAMRRRGLPEPTRQSVRRRPSGTEYLDAEFEEFDIVLEVDGAQHDLPWQRALDLVRDLTSQAEGKAVVRVPMAAWHVGQDRVLDALEALFRSRGWRPAA